MTILRIEEMTYGVGDLVQCIEFLETWGLQKIGTSSNRTSLKTYENQLIHLQSMDDPSLPPSYEDGPTMREVIWGVNNQTSLNEIETELSKDREVIKDDDGTLHSYDDRKNYLGFKIADIVETDLHEEDYNFIENIDRMNERNWPEDKVKPVRIGHLVYSIEAKNYELASAFYRDRLNFRISDQTKDGGTFLRADGSNYHHNLFLFHRQGSHPYFNHVAFEVSSFDQMMVGGTNMLKHGATSVSGPGRHSLGSNWFWYFKNPCGGDIEYFADMDRMDDNWEPRLWDKAPPYARWMMGDVELKG